jgi:hypothetical protein
MVRPCAWPQTATLEAVIRDSQAAALCVDAALLMACLAQAAALQVARSHNTPATFANWLQPPAWLPTPLLAGILSGESRPSRASENTTPVKHGMGNGTEGVNGKTIGADAQVGAAIALGGWAATDADVACTGSAILQMDGYLRLAWYAASLLRERAAADYGVGPAVALVQSLHRSLKVRCQGMEPMNAVSLLPKPRYSLCACQGIGPLNAVVLPQSRLFFGV